MERYFVAVLAALLIASVGGFLLYVPVVSALATLLVLVSLGLMFLLGLYIGSQAQAQSLREDEESRRSRQPEYASR
jgi:hypothetical protein